MRELSTLTMVGAAASILAGAFSGTAVAQGTSRSISNVADSAWEQGPKRFTRTSNRVDVAVEASVPSAPATVATYRVDASGAMHAPIAATRCGVGAANIPIL